MVQKILKKSINGEQLTKKDISTLLKVPLFSNDFSLILSASRQKAEKASNGLAEIHAQIGLNIALCPRNCRFCSFAAENKVFEKSYELSEEDVINRAKEFEADGANAIYLMITADYSFEKYIEISNAVSSSLKKSTIMVANIGDFTRKQAGQLKDAGFSGIYHAVRLGEGRDTTISINKRLETMEYAKEAGLLLGTCVEPVGTEHLLEEIIEKTIITRDIGPVYSGAARRIPIPNTSLAHYGIISEAKMAHILAVVRLALGYEVKGNCTHEPNVIGTFAGANLLWAEIGSNPRDTEEDTKNKRGMSVKDCSNILKEAEWNVLQGPSKFYSK